MHYSTLVAALLPAVLAAPTDDTLDRRQALPNPPKCVEGVHIIAASGHAVGEPHGYGLFGPTVDSIRAAIPHSSNYSIAYPKSSDNYPKAVKKGAKLMRENIAYYAEGCPDTPIVLGGYSEGGIVLTDALCGRSVEGQPPTAPFTAKYASQVIASITYGDETFVSGQSYDYGTCTDGAGVTPRADPSGCDNYAGTLREYCDKGDPECCGGDKPGVHKNYQNKYDTDVTNYVIDQYNAFISQRKARRGF